MKISISDNDAREKMKCLTESIRRGGLPSDPMEIAKLLGIGDAFASMVEQDRRRSRRGRKPRVTEDEGFDEEVLGI